MFRKVKFSIRLKVALTILVLLSSAVSLYFLFAANLFKQDKEAHLRTGTKSRKDPGKAGH